MSGSAPTLAITTDRALRIVVVAARFHGEVVEALVDGAVEALSEAGIPAARVEVIRVPGAWEVPLVVDAALSRSDTDGAVALGCLLRGETAHFELLAEESTRGLGRAMERHHKPVGHGILACETLDQALARSASGNTSGSENKGREAALAVLATIEALDRVGVVGSVRS